MVPGAIGNIFNFSENSSYKVIIKDRREFKKMVPDTESIHIDTLCGTTLVYLPNPCIVRGEIFITGGTFSTGSGRANFTTAAYLRSINFNYQGRFGTVPMPVDSTIINRLMDNKNKYTTEIEQRTVVGGNYLFNDYYYQDGVYEFTKIIGDFLIKDGMLDIPDDSMFDVKVFI
jgi:hypothetical protein